MNNLSLKNIFDVMDHYDVFLFDLWGVIIEGNKTYDHVVDGINKIIDSDKTVLFVSNAPRFREVSYNTIKSWAVNVASPNDVFTSGDIAIQMITQSDKRFNIKSPVVYHLGEDRNSDIMNGLSCKQTNNINEANILLLTLYRDAHENLNEFDNVLRVAADTCKVIICANPDITIPIQGAIRYCSGYFAQKIEKFGAKVIYTGKPYSEIFENVLSYLEYTKGSVNKSRVLMIGDTIETDIMGAKEVGIDSALVLTGNAKRFYLDSNNLAQQLKDITKKSYDAFGILPDFVTEIVHLK